MVKTIKTRESTRDIKALDKAGFMAQHLRHTTVKSKEMVLSDHEEETNQYAINQVTARSKQVAGKTSSKVQQKVGQTIRKKIQAQKIKEKRSAFSDMKKRTKQIKPPKTILSSDRLVFTPEQIQLSHQQKVRTKQTRRQAEQAVTKAKTAAHYGKKGVTKASEVVKKTADALHTVYVFLMTISGGAALTIILLISLIGGIFLTGSSVQASGVSLSQEVLQYTPMIQIYCEQYEIPQFVNAIQAIMMQESGGKGNDPMQCSECPFNEEYSNTPDGITNPEYSIEVGVKYFAECLKRAKCTNPFDTDTLSLAFQGYNYGNEYIDWAISNFGGYTQANALMYSQQMQAKLGTSGYGDPEYVPHVMRYYSYGLMNVGDQPNFSNEQAWGNNNPYSRQGLYGQCTWFAWGRFYEIYGWAPSWTADGSDWVNMLVTQNSNLFRLSTTPDVGSVFSGIGHSHVGIVIAYDGTNITVQEGNLDGRTNTFEEAKTDWQTKVYSLESLRIAYGGVIFATKRVSYNS